MGIGKLGLLAAGLALWYTFNSAPANYSPVTNRYNLPKEIEVVETTLPHRTKESSRNIYSSLEDKIEADKIVKTEDIDFSKKFIIKTNRYRLVKDNDWLPSRIIGHIASLPVKLYFWDWNAGWGLDADKSKAVLAMLENNKDIKGITVRINHTEAFYDWYRMMTEKDLRDRNPFFYRITFGSVGTLFEEMWAELRRGDYYNPLTKTTVLYSNIESIVAHELGHHKDYARFNTDWIYNLSGILPPVTLYKEWKASTNAKAIMSKEDAWQFNRYLMPAFLTYVIATYYSLKKLFEAITD